MKNLKQLNILLLIVLCWATAACSDDEQPVFSTPTISIDGEETMEVKRGESIDITFNLNAEGGNKELLIFRSGGLLDRVPLPEDAESFTYTGQSVPEDAEEGQIYEFEFSLLNSQDAESERIPFVVSAVLYDTILIGGEELYEVEIPEDEIIDGGLSYKFATGRKYYLNRSMRFQAGTSLEVEEGVEIYMRAGNSPLTDIDIEEGAEINMRGTAENPIIITSENTLAAEEAQAGDWGWLNVRVSDGSGELTFIRLEYGGIRNFRLRGITEGTLIENIQVYKAAGEGFMVTGGNVNMRYLVATDCAGGGFRLGDDYAGNIQFAISTVSERLDDNSEVDIRETSSVNISNFTVVGPGPDASNTAGIRMRGNSSGKVYNSIIASLPRRGLRLNDEIQITDLNGPTVFAHSYVFDVPTDPYRDDTDHENPFKGFEDELGEFQNPFFNNVEGFEDGDPILRTIPGIQTNSFVPDEERASEFDPTAINDFFVSAPFVGAVQNSANDWTQGWVRNSDGSLR